MSNYNFTLQDEGERIEIAIKRVRSKWMISNHPELVRSLMNRHTTFDYRRDNKRNDGRVEIYGPGQGGKRTAFPYLSWFAYNHYYKGMKTDEIFDRNIWKKKETTIDHLDGDWRNNTKENLFEMTRAENSSKWNKQKIIKGRFHVALANDGVFCRVQFAYSLSSGRVFVVRYRCRDGENINDCLSYLWENRWKLRNQLAGKVVEDGALYQVSYFPLSRVPCKTVPVNKYALAEKMVSLPEDDFPLFDGGTLE